MNDTQAAIIELALRDAACVFDRLRAGKPENHVYHLLAENCHKALQSKPVDVDIKELKKPYDKGSATTIEGLLDESVFEGWNACLDHLAEKGYLNTPPQSYDPSASLYGEGEEEAKGKDGESPQGIASPVTKEDIDD